MWTKGCKATTCIFWRKQISIQIYMYHQYLLLGFSPSTVICNHKNLVIISETIVLYVWIRFLVIAWRYLVFPDVYCCDGLCGWLLIWDNVDNNGQMSRGYTHLLLQAMLVQLISIYYLNIHTIVWCDQFNLKVPEMDMSLIRVIVHIFCHLFITDRCFIDNDSTEL